MKLVTIFLFIHCFVFGQEFDLNSIENELILHQKLGVDSVVTDGRNYEYRLMYNKHLLNYIWGNDSIYDGVVVNFAYQTQKIEFSGDLTQSEKYISIVDSISKPILHKLITNVKNQGKANHELVIASGKNTRRMNENYIIKREGDMKRVGYNILLDMEMQRLLEAFKVSIDNFPFGVYCDTYDIMEERKGRYLVNKRKLIHQSRSLSPEFNLK